MVVGAQSTLAERNSGPGDTDPRSHWCHNVECLEVIGLSRITEGVGSVLTIPSLGKLRQEDWHEF